MYSWDLIEVLTEKYKHQVISHFDPAFVGNKPPFSSIPEAGYQYYLEVASSGLPNKILVIGNCFGALTGWESARHFKKAKVNILFCAISPAKWIFNKPRDIDWAEKYPSPLKEIMKANTQSSEKYTPAAIPDIKPFFIVSKNSSVPNEWTGLCPNSKISKIDGLPHHLTRYRFGGNAPLTASLIDEFIRLN
jgi:hypothetical protein